METPEAAATTAVVCGYRAAGHPCEHAECPETTADSRWLWTVATNTDEGPVVGVYTTEAEAEEAAALELGCATDEGHATWLREYHYRTRGETRAYIDENGTAVSIQRHPHPNAS